jgi:putative transcriptional regulator
MAATSLKGKLLVALPVLRHADFDRTVVFMLAHGDEGALGVVLNRPSPMPLTEPLPRWSPLASEPAVIFFGGPVGKGDAIGLGESAEVVDTIDLHVEPASIDPPVERVRIYSGYAGWSEGQLEDEIAAGAWVIVDAEPGDVMTDDHDRLWPDVLRRQGGRLAAVATFPIDPALN